MNGGGLIILGTLAGNDLAMEALDTPQQAREFAASLRALAADIERQAVIVEHQQKTARLPKPLTPEDIALTLQIDVKTVQGMFREKQFPGAYKVGKLWRVSRADFERWLQKQRENPSNKPPTTVPEPRTVEARVRGRNGGRNETR